MLICCSFADAEQHRWSSGRKSSWQINFAWRKRRSNSICCNLVAVPCLHIAAHEIQRTELQLVMNGRVRGAWRQFLLNALLISLGLILKYLVSSYWSWLLCCWYIIHDRSSVPDLCIILYSLKALVLTLITPSLQLRAFFCFAVALPGLKRRAGNGAVAQLLVFGRGS
jgi:hypothetical protein